MLRRIFITLLLVIIQIIFCSSLSLAKTQRIGVLPNYGSIQIWNYYKPFIKYLNRETGINWELKLFANYEGVINALCNDEIDIAYLGSVSFGIAHEKCKAEPLIIVLGEDEKPFYKSVIFTSDPNIKSLKDLKGKSIAFGNKKSTGSYVIPRKILEENGISMKDIKPLFLKDHEKIIKAVLNNEAVAGATKESNFKIHGPFNLQIIEYSAPIPHYVFCYKKISPKVERAFKKALIKLKPLNNKSDKNIVKNWDPELRYGFSIPPENYKKEVLELLNIYRKYEKDEF
jgi:phosphonate transport system substrate-binding protein